MVHNLDESPDIETALHMKGKNKGIPLFTRGFTPRKTKRKY